MSGLQTSLLKMLSANGWLVRSDGSNMLAERQGLLSQWLFGKRSVKLFLQLKWDEASKTLSYAEHVVEEKTGLPPPGKRTHPEIGAAEHVEVRRAIEQECRKMGWALTVMPKEPAPAREK